MENDYHLKREKTFHSLFRLYFMIYFCIGILPVNIDNLLENLPGTTEFGIGVVMASFLIVGMISILTFGYYADKISEKVSRKRVFIFTNLFWVITFGLVSLSLNYYFYLFFITLSAIGTGAFLPIGFSIIGDFYSPKERGKKFGVMQFGLILGNGMGIIFGGILGSYTGPLGWRFAYGLGSILGFLSVLSYLFSGMDPERARAEPEFEDFEGEINYNYKITFKNLGQLSKMKSISTILLSVLCSGIATSTLGIWAIFYLSTKLSGSDAELIATTIYVLVGAGGLPGAIIGGRLGDRFFRAGKIHGRLIISLFGLLAGILCMLGFYLIPFFTETPLQIVLSWIFFLILGYLGYLLVSFPMGNQFAIYSEVCVPELRSTANALNGLMVNIGGIIGNLLISSLIEKNMSWLPFAIALVLLIWLFGSLLWILPYFYYPKESKECRDLMAKRRLELEKA